MTTPPVQAVSRWALRWGTGVGWLRVGHAVQERSTQCLRRVLFTETLGSRARYGTGCWANLDRGESLACEMRTLHQTLWCTLWVSQKERDWAPRQQAQERAQLPNESGCNFHTSLNLHLKSCRALASPSSRHRLCILRVDVLFCFGVEWLGACGMNLQST